MRVESLEVVHFLTAGILIRDGREWQIRNNRIEDIGCHTSQPCPRMPGKDANPYVLGRRTIGYGVMLTSPASSGAIVEGNRVANVTKIGIETFTNLAKLGSHERVRDVRIRGNRVSGALGAGIRANCQGDDVTIRGNRIERACQDRLVEQGALHLVGRNEGKSRGLVIEGNQVFVGAGECTYGFSLVFWRDVRMVGGAFLGGRRAALYIRNATDLRLEGVNVSSLHAPPLWVLSNVENITVAADVKMNRRSIKNDGARNFVIEKRSLTPEDPACLVSTRPF